MILIYLHGFQSSSQSTKGTALAEYMRQAGWKGEVELPTLPPRPLLAHQWLQQRMQREDRPVGVLGSSLGGCYAHWLACEYGLKVALINPAVRAHQSMREYLGKQENPYTGEVFELNEEDMAVLRTMDAAVPARPEDILCMLEKGDEVLDWRQAAEKYRLSPQLIHEGGTHAYESFRADIPRILAHLALQI